MIYNKKVARLYNQGATCYLNSVLQVLFMSEDFREAVRHKSGNPDTIDHHLTTLFDNLQKETASTKGITKMLGINTVNEQRDAAEYYEKILQMSSPDASKIFHGFLTHKTTCSTCEKEIVADGAFWHLPLGLVNYDCPTDSNYSVVDGIELHFRASHFSGQNQMYCEQCDAKSDATIKCVMKHHPEVLTLLLKRFEFSYSYMTYVKNNRTVVVPKTLQIPENQTYELYAVVDHVGNLRGGHYTATIKSQDGKWYNFNDDRVGLLRKQLFQRDGLESPITKSDSAYLLFYRKRNVHTADTCNQTTREGSTPEGPLPVPSDINDQGQTAGIMGERDEIWRAKETGNDSKVTVWSDRKQETRNKDTDSVRSRGVVHAPDPCYNMEDQNSGVCAMRNRPYSTKESDEGRNYGVSLDHQDNDSGRLHDICVDLQKNEEMIVKNANRDMGGTMRGNRESDRRGGALTQHQRDRDAEHHGGKGLLVDVEGSTLEEYGPKPASEHKQGAEDKKEVGVKRDKEERTGIKQSESEGQRDIHVADERGRTPGSAKSLTRYDLYKGSVGDLKQDLPKGDQGGEQRYSRHKRLEHQRDEQRDVQGEKKPGISTGLDLSQRTAKEGTHEHVSVDKHGGKYTKDIDVKVGEDRVTTVDKMGKASEKGKLLSISDLMKGTVGDRYTEDVRQRRAKEDRDATQRGVGEMKRVKEKEKNRDPGHVPNRQDSITTRAGSGESRRPTEHQRTGTSEKTRQPQARADLKEGVVEGRPSSKPSKTYFVKLTEVETCSGHTKITEVKSIGIVTAEGSSRDNMKSQVEYDEGYDPKKHEDKHLSESVRKLKLSEKPLLDTLRSKSQQKRKLPSCFSPAREKSEERTKPAKTTGCSPFRKRRKNAKQTSDSE